MALLSNAAISGYVDYTRRNLAYAQYKIGSTWTRAEITSVTPADGATLKVDFTINTATGSDTTITGVRLIDVAGNVWLEKPESILQKSTVEGVLYRVTITIKEG